MVNCNHFDNSFGNKKSPRREIRNESVIVVESLSVELEHIRVLSVYCSALTCIAQRCSAAHSRRRYSLPSKQYPPGGEKDASGDPVADDTIGPAHAIVGLISKPVTGGT